VLTRSSPMKSLNIFFSFLKSDKIYSLELEHTLISCSLVMLSCSCSSSIKFDIPGILVGFLAVSGAVGAAGSALGQGHVGNEGRWFVPGDDSVIGERRHPVAERVLTKPRKYHASRRILVMLQVPI
jgi:hypothetical protein